MSSTPDSWRLHIPKSALKQLARAPRREREQIARALENLARDPLADDTIRLTGHRASYRHRVGNWRILFDLHREERRVDVAAIERRSSTTYRKR